MSRHSNKVFGIGYGMGTTVHAMTLCGGDHIEWHLPAEVVAGTHGVSCTVSDLFYRRYLRLVRRKCQQQGKDSPCSCSPGKRRKGSS